MFVEDEDLQGTGLDGAVTYVTKLKHPHTQNSQVYETKNHADRIQLFLRSSFQQSDLYRLGHTNSSRRGKDINHIPAAPHPSCQTLDLGCRLEPRLGDWSSAARRCDSNINVTRVLSRGTRSSSSRIVAFINGNGTFGFRAMGPGWGSMGGTVEPNHNVAFSSASLL
jgi:hypothetical protein